MWVESQWRRGATVRFTLPNIEVRSWGDYSPFEKSGDRKVRILLVDDSPADVSLLRMALTDAELNCELNVIGDCAEALAFVRQGKIRGQPPPELAVLDFNLPKHDGLEIPEAISENRRFTGVPVAILSSGLSPYELARIQQFNGARYFTKPSTLKEFLRIEVSLKALPGLSKKSACL